MVGEGGWEKEGGGAPRADILRLMAATNQSNNLAYRLFARLSRETAAAAGSSCLTMRSPTVWMARVVRAVSRQPSSTYGNHCLSRQSIAVAAPRS